MYAIREGRKNMKTGHKITAALLALLMVASLLTLGPWTLKASAAESQQIDLEMTYVNPLYEGVVSEDDLIQYTPGTLKADDEDVTYLTDVKSAAKVIRDAMKDREKTIVVYYHLKDYSEDTAKALVKEIAAAALVHTGVPTEGDYLMWQYGGYDAKIGGQLNLNDNSGDLTITYTYTYYTTAAQEEKVDAEVEAILEELNVSTDTDYYKVKAIYDYICANVVYDKAHVNNTSYKTQYTAYGALIDGTSVCQGYAVALYRLALELEVDCRLIPGKGNDENHGWNIVELDNVYYNLDSTWDAGEKEYSWFLLCPETFTDHVRFEDWDTEEFHKAYPMAKTDYVPCTHKYGNAVITTAPTCTETGIKSYTCTLCGHVTTDSVPATGHTYTTSTVAPTCTAEGYDQHTCTVCDYKYADNFTEVVPHDYATTVVEPTCTEEGYTIYSCKDCRAEYKDDYTDMVPHTYTSTVVAPTCTEKGYTEHVCDVCGDKYTDTPTDMVPHKYTTVTVAPTCASRGYDQHTCSVCGYKYTDKDVPPVEHTFVDGSCAECGILSIYRVAGDTRYETSFSIADALKHELCVNQFDTIIVASGTSFADALSGSYLAACKSAPILLANGKNNTDVHAYIKENLVPGGTVYLLGGTSALPASLETGLDGFKVVRLYGNTRYATNLAILKEAGVKDQEILICTGVDFADSLSASATGLPILLVNNITGELTADQITFLKSTSGKFTIVGGEAAVSEDLEKELDAIGTVTRIKGENRYETGVLLAVHCFADPEYAVIAYGFNFPDGLCGGPLAYVNGAPLILTAPGYEYAAEEYTTKYKITQGYVLGGSSLVSDDITRSIFGMEEDAKVPLW